MIRSTLLFLLWCLLMGSSVNGQIQDFVPVAEGWICDENFQPHVATNPLTRGSLIRICIQPTNWTKSRNVVMQSIDRFVFSKGDRGKNGVQDVIKDGQLTDPGGTIIDCHPGAEICTFKTKLSDIFFYPPKDDSGNPLPPSFTVIQGNGAVTMQYARGRRLLRGTIDFQRSLEGWDTPGTVAGTDDVQIQGIVISELKGGASGGSGGNGTGDTTSLAGKWQSLPTWAKATICVGALAFAVCCCCALGFFGWYAGVESARRKVKAQHEAPVEPMYGDYSARTLDDDGSSLPSPGQEYGPGRMNRRSHSPSNNRNHLDSSNRSAHGRRPTVRNGSHIPNRPYRSHSPQLYRSNDDDESTVETNMYSRDPRTSSLPVKHAPSGGASVSRATNKRHASLGPPSVQSRRSTGLSQSQHSYLPRRGSSGVSVSSSRPQNNTDLSDRSTHSKRPSASNGHNGLSQSQHQNLPRRVSSAASVSNNRNQNNSDLSDRSTHSNRPLTRTTYHGPPSRPGRVGPQRSFGPDTTRTSMAGRGRGANSNHGPPPIRIPVRSDPSRRPPGQQPPHIVHVGEESDSSSRTDDDDDMASFASTSSTPSTPQEQSDTESLSENSRNQNEKPRMSTVNTKKVAPPRTEIKAPVKKWAKTDGVRTETKAPVKKWAKTPAVPGRPVATTGDAEATRESVGNLPNETEPAITKKVVTKKKKKKVVGDSPSVTEDVEEPPPKVVEEVQEEAWGDQLD